MHTLKTSLSVEDPRKVNQMNRAERLNQLAEKMKKGFAKNVKLSVNAITKTKKLIGNSNSNPLKKTTIVALPKKENGLSSEFDARTEKNIATLIPEAQKLAREFMRQCLKAGLNIKIICGTRTYAEQDALYAQGRTTKGNIVTNARGGYSWHNFGIAFDVGVFDELGRYYGNSPVYKRAGQIGKSLGLEWGGDWKFVDEPHFQMKLGITIAEARRRMSKNNNVLVA